MLNIVKELPLVLVIDQNWDVFGDEVKALPPLRPEYQHALVAEIGDYVWLVNNTPAKTTLTVVSDYLEKLIVDNVLTNDNVSNEYQYITQMSSLYAQYRQAVTAYYKFFPMLTERAFS